MQINRKCGLACVNELHISSLYTNGFWHNSTRPTLAGYTGVYFGEKSSCVTNYISKYNNTVIRFKKFIGHNINSRVCEYTIILQCKS